jgi:amino acid permease
MNIPMIYYELEKKDAKHMWKVMSRGTIGATIAYITVGIFGYSTFSQYGNVGEIMEI